MVVRPDFEADVTALRFPPGSVAEVRLHHVFEHFNRIVALGLLIRWHEWLRPGGVLLIETHDFLATAEAALRSSGRSRVGLVRHLEGDHSDDWAYHVGQWYPERFERTLSALGFDAVSTERHSTAEWHDPPLHNVVAHAVKLNDVPQAELLRRADVLLRESVVAESEVATWAKWCEQLREFIRGGAAGSPAAHAALPAPG